MSTSDIKSFGVLIDGLNNNQLTHTLLFNLNKIIQTSPNYSPTIFYQSIGQSSMPSMAAKVHYCNAWNYPHTLIATNLNTASILLNCIRPKKRLFYVHDPEWVFLNCPPFELVNNIYNNPKIQLIARSKSHFDLIKRVWKEPIGIVENFNIEQLVGYV
jgi:hypothetical protein